MDIYVAFCMLLKLCVGLFSCIVHFSIELLQHVHDAVQPCD